MDSTFSHMVTHMFGTEERFAMKMHVLWIHARGLLWVVAGLGVFGGQRSPAGEPPARATFKGHTDLVRSVVFSADGKTLASGSWDKTAKIWNVDSGEEKASLKGHTGPIMSVAFSADAKSLATGSIDKTVKLWNVANQEERFTLIGHAHSVYSVVFSPDGKTLASAS
jgi:WD40 repeat protein